MLGNEAFYILRAETEHSPSVTEAHDRDPGIAPSGMVAHPGLRYAKLVGHLIEGQKPRVVGDYGKGLEAHDSSSSSHDFGSSAKRRSRYQAIGLTGMKPRLRVGDLASRV